MSVYLYNRALWVGLLIFIVKANRTSQSSVFAFRGWLWPWCSLEDSFTLSHVHGPNSGPLLKSDNFRDNHTLLWKSITLTYLFVEHFAAEAVRKRHSIVEMSKHCHKRRMVLIWITCRLRTETLLRLSHVARTFIHQPQTFKENLLFRRF